MSLFEIFGLVVLVAVLGLALWRGGPAERRVAVVIVIAWLGSTFSDAPEAGAVQWRILIIDGTLAAYLLAEALTSARLWTVFAFLAQFMIVMTHVAAILQPAILVWGFYTAYYVWSYAVLLALLTGALTARRAARRAAA